MMLYSWKTVECGQEKQTETEQPYKVLKLKQFRDIR